MKKMSPKSEKAPSKMMRKLVATGEQIAEISAREADAIGYGTAHLINCTLPHTDPKNHVFERRAGDWLKMTITSSKGIPYGTRARLYYARLITRAVQTRSRVVVLAPTLTQLARELGSGTNGPVLRSWQEQLRRCFSSTWEIEAIENRGDKKRVYRKRWIIEEAQEYVVGGDPNQLQIFEPTVKLSQDFYDAIVDRAVPFDMRSMKVLASTRSSLAMDIYVWLTLKTRDLKHPREYPFGWLMQQFGTGFDPANKKHRSNFQIQLKSALKKIKVIWPELKVHLEPGCLVIHPGRPHVRMVR